MAKASTTYQDIVHDIEAGHFSPVYYLMGDEPYYIDRLSEYIVAKALAEEERDFNLTILYGSSATVEDVVTAAKRYPMMAERQVVVVREVGQMSHLEVLAYYLQQPLTSTILVLCHKHGKIDLRTKFAVQVQKQGVLFESRQLYDRELPIFVNEYLRERGSEISPEANAILCDFVGANLSRLTSELDKLLIALPADVKRINAELIEQHVGISKDYNSFELIAALSERNILKANKIVKYFYNNPKNFSLQQLLATLAKYFGDVMQACYAPSKSEADLAASLGQAPWQVRRNIMPALRNYSAMKVFNIIDEIRKTDAASKGIGEQKGSDGELLQELIFYILH